MVERSEIENQMVVEKRERRVIDEKVVYYRPKPPFEWMEEDEEDEEI